MKKTSVPQHLIVVAALLALGFQGRGRTAGPPLSAIRNIVIIYAENRSFDNLYGTFPGANGLQHVQPGNAQQLDRNGSPLPILPPIWNGLTERGVTPAITQAMTMNLPNRPFAIDDPNGFNAPPTLATRDLWHRFYENQMQINGGEMDQFAAWADAGALVMGHYGKAKDELPLWNLAEQFTLTDNFFMAAFGGSFLNHQWLICACTPTYPHADPKLISAVNADGVSLQVARNSPASALDGPPKFVNSANLTPDFYAVNTIQPPYQPSGNKPPVGGDPTLADPAIATTLPPQTQKTIGDLLNDAAISWAWYAGGWSAALTASQSGTSGVINGAPLSTPNFQPHHQPFNYYVSFAPGTANRAKHLLDGGLEGTEFLKVVDAGALPQVAFYKPQGNLNEHASLGDVVSGDRHIAEVVSHLQKSPQWNNMVVIVTYDENGGFWDHVAPPKADRWGPGLRVPTIVISPFAKKRFVDHTQYDTTSIIRLISRRFSLPPLPGITARDQGLLRNRNKPMGDLTNTLLPTMR